MAAVRNIRFPKRSPTFDAVCVSFAPMRNVSKSILISAVRCVLTYVIFPWVMPLLGRAGDVGPMIGSIIGVIAIGFNVASIRRFWISNHKWKWPITVLNGSVIILLLILLSHDLSSL